MYIQHGNFSSYLNPRDKNKYLVFNNIYIKTICQSKFSKCVCSASKWSILEQPCHTRYREGPSVTLKCNYTDMIKFPILEHFKVGKFDTMLDVTAAKVKSWVTRQLIWPLLKVSTSKMTTAILTFPGPLRPKSLLHQ